MKALDINEIDYIYQIFLGRGLNFDERTSIDAALAHDSRAFDPEHFRKTLMGSPEFIIRNREEFLLKLFRGPCIVAARTPLGQEIFVDIRQLHLGFAIAAGDFEPLETAFVIANVKPGMHVCDIGANAGYFSLICAGLVGNAGSVLAFEPVGETFARLTAAVARNGLGNIIRPHNLALADYAGSLWVVYERDGSNIGGAHLVRNDGVPETQVRESVQVRTLDEIVGRNPVHFVKMDVEGAEGLVLAGARKAIREQLPTLLIEFNVPQLMQISHIDGFALAHTLEEMGYGLFEIIDRGQLRPFTDTSADIARLTDGTGIFNCVACRKE